MLSGFRPRNLQRSRGVRLGDAREVSMLGAQLTGITDDGRKNATSAATAGAAEQRLLPPSASTKAL